MDVFQNRPFLANRAIGASDVDNFNVTIALNWSYIDYWECFDWQAESNQQAGLALQNAVEPQTAGEILWNRNA
jgi:hypothetical protein